MIEEIRKALIEVIGNDEGADSWDQGTDILADVGLDSVQLIEFLLKIEETMGVEFDFENLEYDMLRSIGMLAEKLEEMKKEA
ncbi:MAG: acyl carrier protein [Lachnospiraceae bacterium]|nr:acyl carrier protein [Lachnospiraceae bacterium]MBP5221757.1 acyl carrier protein [Lachnospiraceae bacterium]